MRLCDNHPEWTMDASDRNNMTYWKAKGHEVEFDCCIEFLTRSGKVTFGPSFAISPSDYKVDLLPHRSFNSTTV